MSDDGDKTEAPTARRLQKAREEEGNVPKSEDANGMLHLLITLGVVYGFAQMAYMGYHKPIAQCFESAFITLKVIGLSRACADVLSYSMVLILVFFAIEILGAFVIYILMNKGFLMPENAFKLKLDAFNFIANFKNLFKKEQLTSFFTSIVKEVLIYGIFAYTLHKYFQPIIYEAYCGNRCESHASAKYIWVLVLSLLPIAIVFALIDYPMRVYFYIQSMRMSHKDLKDEHKESEGSPEVKQHQNEFRWELLNGLPVGPKAATFFVRSAEKIIGIRYRPEESPAPMVVSVAQSSEPTQRMAAVGFNMRRLVIWDDQFANTLSTQAQLGQPVPLTFLQDIRQALGKLRQHEAKNGVTHAGEKVFK